MTSKRAAIPLLLASAVLAVRAQLPANVLPLNVRFSTTRAQTVPGNCCFYLTGGAADLAIPLLAKTSLAVELNGNTTGHVAGTARGLSTITLLAGPRYTLPLNHFAVAGQALFGVARGFDADFTSSGRNADTATAFAFAAGGFVEVPLARSLRLRLVQVDCSQTNLPNGADNRQRSIRLGAGITLNLALPRSRR